jgi:hypothetical protein
MKKYLKFTGVLVTMMALQSNMAHGYGIGAKGIFEHGNPVHEAITRKAAIDSKYLSAEDTYQMNHLIEGVRFNDDPEAYLAAGNVLGFGAKFLGKNKSKTNPTEAFHFGDYQFMHAMAKGGMPAHKVQNHIMLYAYHCWLSATDNDSYAKFKLTYESVSQKIQNKSDNSEYGREELIMKEMIQLFPREVLFYNTDNQNSFQNRALGSLLHMIQDSYAKGHTVRGDWEVGSNSGDIIYFQDYKEQDSHQHELHDVPKSGKVTESTVAEIPGAKMAYLRSKQVLEMAAKKCPWASYDLNQNSSCSQSVYSFLNEEVFALDKNTSIESKKTHSHKELTQPIVKPQDEFNQMYGGG